MESRPALIARTSANSNARCFVEIQFYVSWKGHSWRACAFFTLVSADDALFVFAEAKHHYQRTQAMWTVFLDITTLIQKQNKHCE